MKQDAKTPNSLQSQIEKVRKQFEDWRNNRIKRSAIPEPLWKAAVELYPEHKICRISKALRLNYSRLKARILNASEKKNNSAQPQIEKVRKQFEYWRKNRKSIRNPIPELLWEKAIGLHPEYSICCIAKVLRLEYSKLKSLILKGGEKDSNRFPQKIEKVRKQLDDWRKDRKSIRSPIPERLWEAAARLYPEYSVCRISKALRLEHGKLKKQILNAPEKRPKSAPAFIQLDIAGAQPMQNGWLIEMANADGAKLKISGDGLEMPDFALICQNFLEG